MNKYQKDLLSKCKHVGIIDDVPLLDDVYILPTNKKHDSGYKIMYVCGLSRENNEYYLLDRYCDVVNFGEFFETLKGINIDILHNGIIHCWSNTQQMKSNFRVSNCTFSFIDIER